MQASTENCVHQHGVFNLTNEQLELSRIHLLDAQQHAMTPGNKVKKTALL